MQIFEFLNLLSNEKYPFTIEYIEWSKSIKVNVDTFSKIEVYEFNETGIMEHSELIETAKTENQSIIETKIENLTDRTLKTWIEAAEDLKIRFIHPYAFVGIDKAEYIATGLLPDFGSEKGILILSRKDEAEVFKMAELSGNYFLSVLNPTYYDQYNRERFIETLSDWSWIGKANKPDWIIENEAR